jgi:hypothetical protein
MMCLGVWEEIGLGLFQESSSGVDLDKPAIREAASVKKTQS